jgi:hypothetical protein
VSRFTDDEIDSMYARLIELEAQGLHTEGRRAQRAALRDRILVAERERAKEMSSYFWNHQPLEPEELTELLNRVHAAAQEP